MIGNKNEVKPVNARDLMDMALMIDGNLPVSVENIEKMGWKEVLDRGMAENYGHLFYWPTDHWVLRFWTPAPRIEISYKNSVGFDSAIADYANFGPGKPISMGLLKQFMMNHNIIKHERV